MNGISLVSNAWEKIRVTRGLRMVAIKPTLGCTGILIAMFLIRTANITAATALNVLMENVAPLLLQVKDALHTRAAFTFQKS